MKTIHYKKIHYLILAGILLVAVIGAAITQKQAATGMTPLSIDTPYYAQKEKSSIAPVITRHIPAYPQKGPAQVHKIEAIDHIIHFFGTAAYYVPENPCAKAIEEQLHHVDLLETARIETFSGGTGWTDKYKTILFEGDKTIGKITLVHGFGNPHQVKMNYEIAKTIVSINAWQETMDLKITLEGTHNGQNIRFTKGSLEVFDFQCRFGY